MGGWRFRLFGVPVRVDGSFFIMALILGARQRDPAMALIWVAAVFVAVLAHEFGHAVAIRACGMAPVVRLYSMGGVTYSEAPQPIVAWQRVGISLAGPGAGFALGAVTLAAAFLVPKPTDPHVKTALLDLLWVSFGWGVLNLLPILPLDGGNIVRTLVHALLGRPDDRIPRLVSAVFAALILGLALHVREYWGAFLAGYFMMMNLVALRSPASPAPD